MSEIPEDVMKTARAEASRWFNSIGSSEYHFADAIARAIIAERERCAKIAEGCDLDPEYAEFVAQAIRSSHD